MGEPISVEKSAVSMMSLIPTAMPRNGPALGAWAARRWQTKAPIVLSCAAIASSDCAIAASAERSPEAMRRWRSASEIMARLRQGDEAGFKDDVRIGQAAGGP